MRDAAKFRNRSVEVNYHPTGGGHGIFNLANYAPHVCRSGKILSRPLHFLRQSHDAMVKALQNQKKYAKGSRESLLATTNMLSTLKVLLWLRSVATLIPLYECSRTFATNWWESLVKAPRSRRRKERTLLTLMTYAQVVETSVTNNSSFQN